MGPTGYLETQSSLAHYLITLILVYCLVSLRMVSRVWILVFFGSIYHKFIEEEEVLLRFGEQYEDCRNETPFLIPRLKIRKS